MSVQSTEETLDPKTQLKTVWRLTAWGFKNSPNCMGFQTQWKETLCILLALEFLKHRQIKP